MNDFFAQSAYFGIFISLFAFFIGYSINKKTKLMILNPLLIAMLLIIAFLKLFNIDYETYDYGAKYITYFLTPATICLALPLYRQLQVLKKNYMAIFAGIVCGVVTHLFIILLMAFMFTFAKDMVAALLSTSVTMAIAVGVTQESAGLMAVTVIGVPVAGLTGAILGPAILKLCGVTEPEAQGLALGTASHALGVSRACELGEVQAAMSSLAIVVTGVLTVAVVPLVVSFL